jgi:hypothetical protein
MPRETILCGNRQPDFRQLGASVTANPADGTDEPPLSLHYVGCPRGHESRQHRIRLPKPRILVDVEHIVEELMRDEQALRDPIQAAILWRPAGEARDG